MKTDPEQTLNRPSRMHVYGLDSLRFVAASVVVLGHLGVTRDEDFGSNSTFLRAIQIILGISFNGPLAVMVFFIISGFVIHLPNRETKDIAIRSFYTRRAIRIVLPGATAFLSGFLIGRPTSPPNIGVYWSLVCELLFYLAYPLLHRIAQGSGKRWNAILAASCAASATLMACTLELIRANQNIHGLGILTAILTLPVWLLGVRMAQLYTPRRKPPTPRRRLMLIRGGIVAMSSALMAIRFHGSGLISSNAILLLAASPVLYLWISVEIRSFSSTSAVARWLDRQGSWSYSLYLCHLLPWPLMEAAKIPVHALPRDAEPFVRIIAGIVFSYGFFVIVERPSHSLARLLAKKVSSPRDPRRSVLDTGDASDSTQAGPAIRPFADCQHQPNVSGTLPTPSISSLATNPVAHLVILTNPLGTSGPDLAIEDTPLKATPQEQK